MPHAPHDPDLRDGRRHLGALERVVWRQWPEGEAAPTATLVGIIDRLAALPDPLKHELAAELYGVFVGPGGVPDLDSMGHLRARVLPSGTGRWDDSAGAYLQRMILLGDRPTPTPDVVLHEVAHALDELRGEREMVSDGALWGAVYRTCQPFLALSVHRAEAPVGRREFFADALAAVASRATVELLDWLNGNRDLVLLVAAYFRQQFPDAKGW